VQTGSNNRTIEIYVLRNDYEREICKISENFDFLSANVDETLIVGIHVSNTRNELATSKREINQRSRALEWAGYLSRNGD
jgi:hypothetical protein